MRLNTFFLSFILTTLLLSGCSVTKTAENLQSYTTASINFQTVKMMNLVVKLDEKDRSSARSDINKIERVLTLSHKFQAADNSEKKSLLLNLPSMITDSRGSLSRLTILVQSNLDKFSDRELNVLRAIRGDLIQLSLEWATLADNDKVRKLLLILETGRTIKQFKELKV